MTIREMMAIEHIIRRLMNTGTFSGNNFFPVTKTTVMAMFSTIITYLVVLLQTPDQT
jgi:7tm Chemosensory receptor